MTELCPWAESSGCNGVLDESVLFHCTRCKEDAYPCSKCAACPFCSEELQHPGDLNDAAEYQMSDR